MNTKNNILKITLATALAAGSMGMIGCGSETAEQPVSQPAKPQISQLEVEITDVQPQSLPLSWHHGGANYPITYVLGKDEKGNLVSFIYPDALGVHKRRATIEFQKTVNGEITQKELYDQFFNKLIYYNPNVVYGNSALKADGIITPDGIKYHINVEKEK